MFLSGLRDEATFLVNYHLRSRLPGAVCALEGARTHLLGPAKARVFEREDGNLTLGVGILEERLEHLMVRRIAGEGAIERRWRSPGPSPDLEVFEVASAERRRWARRGFFILPIWVRQVVDLSRHTEIVPRSRHSRRRVKLVLRRGYDFEVAHDARSFESFYHRMYVPTMIARHGREAYVRGPAYLWRGFRRGALLMIRRGGERVAGILNLRSPVDPYQVTTWAGGLLDGNLALLGEDADSACIYFSLRWAREQTSCTRLSLSVTRPFLNDGLLRYRKGWGALVEREDLWADKVVALGINRFTPTVRAVLDDNPFIVASHQGLAGVARWRGGLTADHRDLRCPGLSSLTLLVEADHPDPPPEGPARLLAPASVFRLTRGREVAELRELARALAA